MESSGPVTHERLGDDMFLVSDGTRSVAFAPLRGKAFSTTPAGTVALRSYFRQDGASDGQVRSFLEQADLLSRPVRVPLTRDGPYAPESPVLSLTSGCNLRCIYCYASAGPEPQAMTFETAREAIDVAMQAARARGRRVFRMMFHGGGEPLTAWSLLRHTTEYASERWSGPTRFSLVTNATLITRERTAWFKKHGFRFTTSLDGPRDIHDKQRPRADGTGSFDATIRGIRRVVDAGLNCGIRATITGSNVDRLEELVQIAAGVGCGLKVEPFTPTGRGEHGVAPVGPTRFFHAVVGALEVADRLGIELQSSYLPDLAYPRGRFCGANGRMFCVLPDGRVSTCSRVTRADDELAEAFSAGRILNGRLQSNPASVMRAQPFAVQESRQCRECFAMWHCAGGCLSQRVAALGQMPEDHCQLARQLLWFLLTRQLDGIERR